MKLSLKLAISILILAATSSGLVAVMSYVENSKRVDQRAINSIQSLVSTVASMASTSAYVNDVALGEEVVRGLELNEEIRCAEIITSEMHSLSSGSCKGEPTLARALLSPWDADEVVGSIRVYQSHEYVDTLVREQFIVEITSLVKVILIISASILILTHVVVASPIARVSDKLENADFENEIALLDEGRRVDEIGTISRVINLMIANAKKQIISEKMMASKTEELSNHFRLIFQLSKNFLVVTDDKLRLQSCNPTFENMVASLSPESNLEGSDNWMESLTNDPSELKAFVASVVEMNKPITTQVKFETIVDSSKNERYYSITFVKSHSNDMGVSVLFFIYDMTEHQKKLQRTEYEADHDNLTSLYNRRAATRKIRHLLSSKEDDESVAIIFIDLDGFKDINDELGHDAGDLVLKEVGKRLCSNERSGDVVCRWGGDEFLIALNNVALADATAAADKLLKKIVSPIGLSSGEYCQVGASIGVTLSTNEVRDFQSLLDHADKAMYRVKKSSKNAVLVHAL